MQLVLMRHAHAQNHGPDGDHSRPLSEHGRAQAHETANFLRSYNIAPDYAIVSDAVRTTETFLDLQFESKVEFSKRAYNATANTLAQLITEVADDISSIVLVAHNPGVTDLAYMSGYEHNMSTGTAVIIDWDGSPADFVSADKRVVANFSPS